jgi:hypothetical protein
MTKPSPATMPKTKAVTTFVFEPVGWDLFAPTQLAPPAGTLVVKTQPSGCPKNGTMGHTYVADAKTGDFLGLVLLNSLRTATAAEKASL